MFDLCLRSSITSSAPGEYAVELLIVFNMFILYDLDYDPPPSKAQCNA